MSMFGTIYKGTTGLVTFSRGLDVISNNVANMNTPGFKRSDLLFRDLFYQYRLTGESDGHFSSRKDGAGVTERGTTTSFAQGDIQQSGNQTDAAINGNGFFILRGEDGIFYSRAGQFQIDADGYLIASANEARVAGIDAAGALVDIGIAGLRTHPSTPTTEVSFVNNLSTGSTEHVIEGIEVFDAGGNPRQLNLTLRSNPDGIRSWLAEIEEDGEVLATGLEIRFQGNGSPAEDFNAFSFTLGTENAGETEIRFLFGEPGSFTGATSFSAGPNSDLAVDSQDGIPFGALTGISIDRDGIMQIEYSNGESARGGRLALAWLNDLQSMRQIGNGLFAFDHPERLRIDAANAGVMGEIAGGSIEISNVELSQEFTDLVIIQRGFQVSSQVVGIANEMIQQLIDSSGSRR